MRAPSFKVVVCDASTREWASDGGEFEHMYLGEVPRIGETIDVADKLAKVVRVDHVTHKFADKRVAELMFQEAGQEMPTNWNEFGFSEVVVGVVPV